MPYRVKVKTPKGWTTKQIQERYGVCRTTAWKAVKQGYFHFTPKEDYATEKQTKAYLAVMRLPFINRTAFDHAVTAQKFHDVAHGRVNLLRHEYTLFEVAIQEVLAVLQGNKGASTREVIAIRDYRPLKHYVIFKGMNAMLSRIYQGGEVNAKEQKIARKRISEALKALKSAL